MDKKTVIIIAVVIVIILIGAWYIMSPKPAQSQPQTESNTQTNNQTQNTMDTTNGLKIDVVQQGTGDAVAKMGDKVTVNYTGTLTDGTKFDSSLNPGRTPFQFTLGPDCQKDHTCVIEGWNLGVVGMKVGEKRKLTIPPELGYGANANGPIPASSTLLFDVELLKIN